MEGKNINTKAEGFSFNQTKDAKLAEEEKKKIEYLESKLDYNKPESIYKIYEKAVHERIFKTPVGLMYLKKLQDYLKEQTTIDHDKISDIPIFENYEEPAKATYTPVRKRIEPAKPKKEKVNLLTISLILNALLIIAIIVMFKISLNSSNPNILNYENAITNKYSYWEEQLKERENVIREKEKELNINP